MNAFCQKEGRDHNWIDHLTNRSGAQTSIRRICLDCGLEQPYVYKRTLREANEARQAEWKAQALSRSFKLCELAGEVGEACNILKKLEREELGLVGSRTSAIELMQELADVVICLDLLAMNDGLPAVALGEPSSYPHEWSYTEIGARLAFRTGSLCDLLNGTALHNDIVMALELVGLAAQKVKGDLNFWVERKFNNTSEARGLLTRMGEQP